MKPTHILLTLLISSSTQALDDNCDQVIVDAMDFAWDLSGKPFTGYHTCITDEKTSITSYKNGIIDGLSQGFYKNFRYETHHVNGKLVGDCGYISKNGKESVYCSGTMQK